MAILCQGVYKKKLVPHMTLMTKNEKLYELRSGVVLASATGIVLGIVSLLAKCYYQGYFCLIGGLLGFLSVAKGNETAATFSLFFMIAAFVAFASVYVQRMLSLNETVDTYINHFATTYVRDQQDQRNRYGFFKGQESDVLKDILGTTLMFIYGSAILIGFLLSSWVISRLMNYIVFSDRGRSDSNDSKLTV